MDFSFFMPARMLVGDHVVEENSGLLAELGTRCLLVTGKNSARLSGALDDVTAALDRHGIPWEIFDGIGQNPLLSSCLAAGRAARDFGADFLIGIGGGSPLDAAKAAAVYAANPQLGPRDIYSPHSNPALPFALVGTTAGTGSEVTKVSVLTDDETGRKKSISYPDLYARLSLGDPRRYTATLPRRFTISTALDAVCHSVESYFAKSSDPISRACAVEALLLLIPALRAIQEPESLPDSDQRQKLYLGSIYAGLAFNGPGLCFPHTMGYVLSEEYGVPHGEACAVFLPQFIETAAREEAQLSSRLFARLGTRKPELAAFVESFVAGLPLPVLTDQELEDLLPRWEGNPNMARTPGDFGREKRLAVLKKVFQRQPQTTK
jgi:alcohol dehydrogenase class IV